MRSNWPAYAAAVWSALFAVRAVYWATGGSVGLGTLSDDLQRSAAAGDPSVIAALWVVAVLLLLGTVLALALARRWGRIVPAVVPLIGRRPIPAWIPLLVATVAGGVLSAHGATYVSLLVTQGAATAELRWYGLLWGPWFALGGVRFLLAGERFRRRSHLGRPGLAVLLVGMLVGAVAAFGPMLIGWLVGVAS